MAKAQILEGNCLDVLATLDAGSVQTCITSPPYWGLRDYGDPDQIGQEPESEQYVERLVDVFRQVRRVLADDGTLWLNLGDCYAGKQLTGIPWMVAFALQREAWFLRSDIIWAKPNAMPESVTDRPSSAHEHLFLFAPESRYYYDGEAIKEPVADVTLNDARFDRPVERDVAEAADRYGDGTSASRRTAASYFATGATSRNKRNVWTVQTAPFPAAHFATFPPKLIEPCILAGSRPGDVVLDPFNGAGTTGVVALRHDRDYIGIELNPTYAQMARDRIYDDGPLLNEVAA